MLGWMRPPSRFRGRDTIMLRRLGTWLFAVCVACGSTQTPAPNRRTSSDEDVLRYRLQLRHNPVDAGEAFRCYGRCQSEPTPQEYVECLSDCPGFEITQGAYCAKDEVPPVAACLTVRRVRAGKEVDPGLVVLAVVGSIVLVVGAASLCSSSTSQCGYGYGYVPR